jgi:hypothetical protein
LSLCVLEKNKRFSNIFKNRLETGLKNAVLITKQMSVLVCSHVVFFVAAERHCHDGGLAGEGGNVDKQARR